MRVFVTGTDTDVGKTVVSAWLCRQFNLDYFKPVQAGVDPATDSERVGRYADCHIHPESYRLRVPASPHYAAELEGRHLSLADIRLPDASRLVVEGAGGVMVPLGAGYMMIDLITSLALPVLLVASTRLGTLNHTLLTLAALRSRRIRIMGVILNGESSQMLARTIADYGEAAVLQQFPLLKEVSASTLDSVTPTAALCAALEGES